MEQNRKVKSMKKKLAFILCLCLMVLGLAACGNTEETDYFGMSYENLKTGMEQEMATLISLDADSIDYLKQYGSDVQTHLVETWEEAVDGLGECQGLGEITITKTQDTVTVDQILEYPGRQVVVTYVYTYNYGTKAADLTDASADKVYTMGEKMGKAGLNTLMGMGTVFSVLILISLLIYCFRFIPGAQNKKAPEKNMAPPPVRVAVSAAPTRRADNLELVAVITAAIAASEGTSTDSFVVRSIRRR